jgi:hypothetical protein
VESIFYTYEVSPNWPLILTVIGVFGILCVELYKLACLRDPRPQPIPDQGTQTPASTSFPSPSAPAAPRPTPSSSKYSSPAGPPPKAASVPPDTGPSVTPSYGFVPGWGSWPTGQEPQEEPQTLFEDLPDLPFPGEVPSNRDFLWATWAAILFNSNEERERIIRHDRTISEAWSSFARFGNRLRGHTWEHGYRVRVQAVIHTNRAKSKSKGKSKGAPVH